METLGPIAWRILDIVRVFALLSLGIWLLLDVPAKKKKGETLPWYDYVCTLATLAIVAWVLEDLLSPSGRLQPLMASIIMSVLTAFNVQLQISLTDAAGALLGVIKLVSVLAVGIGVLLNLIRQSQSPKGIDLMTAVNPLIAVAVVGWFVVDALSPDSAVGTLIGLIVTLVNNSLRAVIGG